jgi:hypothetical protein
MVARPWPFGFKPRLGGYLWPPDSNPPERVQALDSYIKANEDRFLNELLDLLRIPSVSADPKYKADVARCAEAVKKRMLEAGLEKVEVCPTAGHPIVYGEKIVDPSKPTVLVYGHYDVQPADPVELWHSGPFDPCDQGRHDLRPRQRRRQRASSTCTSKPWR